MGVVQLNHVGQRYVEGAWEAMNGRSDAAVMNPTTEEPIVSIPVGDRADVDRAVAAANRASVSWRDSDADTRSAVLTSMADGIEARLDELAATWTLEVGIPLSQARAATAALPISAIRSFADLVHEVDWERRSGGSLVRQEPVGVAASITPWNYPLSQIAIKTASALAAGCTVVAKPSEVAPLCAYVFAEIVESLDIPPGLFNLVPGDGPTTGEALVKHPGVRLVSFTGSTGTGSRIMELASSDITRVTLELGGKSPLILMEDAPLERAVTTGIDSCYRNAGQTCTSLTRLLVPRSRAAEVAELAVARAESYVVGDPMDPATTLGPLVSKAQLERVRDLVSSGVDQGATLLTGGVDAPSQLDRGYFFQPTVFADVSNEMRIAQEEIFGPVLAIIAYQDIDEAISLANRSDYGLSAAVWSGDQDRAVEVARRIDAGTVFVNEAGLDPLAPYGGTKRSGLGRELGLSGIEEYLEPKAIHVPR